MECPYKKNEICYHPRCIYLPNRTCFKTIKDKIKGKNKSRVKGGKK